MTKDEEFKFIMKVADDVEYAFEDATDQAINDCIFPHQEFGLLISLWTSFCLHNEILVDTREYDLLIDIIWFTSMRRSKFYTDKVSRMAFENRMCQYMV